MPRATDESSQNPRGAPGASASGAPDVDLALEAIDTAARVAESGEWTPPPVAAPTDFRALEVGRVRSGLERILLGRDPESGLDALLVSGFLPALLPEINSMVGFGDGEFLHKDVWKHTKQVVRQSVPRIEVRWAALLHDIGKIKTRKISPDGEVHFIGHAEVGASMFDRMQRRLPLFRGDDKLADSIRFLILHHLRASGYDRDWTDSAVRRFAREMGPCLGDLFDLSRADITTKSAERRRRGLESISELSARVRALAELDAKVPPLPKGLGTAITARFGIEPSPVLGELMKTLRAAAENGEIEAQQDYEYYLDHLVRAGLVPKP